MKTFYLVAGWLCVLLLVHSNLKNVFWVWTPFFFPAQCRKSEGLSKMGEKKFIEVKHFLNYLCSFATKSNHVAFLWFFLILSWLYFWHNLYKNLAYQINKWSNNWSGKIMYLTFVRHTRSIIKHHKTMIKGLSAGGDADSSEAEVFQSYWDSWQNLFLSLPHPGTVVLCHGWWDTACASGLCFSLVDQPCFGCMFPHSLGFLDPWTEHHGTLPPGFPDGSW